MAEHVSEQVVEAAKAALIGLATTGANVFDSRVYPVQDNELPCLLIDQGNETSEIESMGFDRITGRTMELLVVAKVKQNTSYRTLINTIRKEVEVRLAANQGIGGAKYVQPKSCEIELAGEGEKPVASATLTFEVPYYTALSTPDVPL